MTIQPNVKRQEAQTQLAHRFAASLNGLAMQALGRGVSGKLPAETPDVLARIAVEWAAEHGLTFDG